MFRLPRPALRSPWLALAILVAAGALPSVTHAQQGCELGPGSELLVRNPDGRGGFITHLTTPHFECDDDVEIWADSAIAYSTDRMSILIGSVRYLDASRELTAREARYFSDVGRLQAQGDVVVVDREDGSRVENGDLVYLRQTDFRAEESMTFTTGRDGRRPRAMVPPPPEPDSVPSDSLAAPDGHAAARNPTPYLVVGNQLFFRGSDDFTASGDVEIERDSLFAFADSAEYAAALESLVLIGSARVVSSAYELVGRTITMGTASGGANEIRAVREALLTGDDLTLTAQVIKLYLIDGAVERVVAVPLGADGAVVSAAGPGAGVPRDSARQDSVPATATAAGTSPDSADVMRPVALAERFELTADSLELTAPGAVVERIFAAGRARSVSQARDSLNVDALPELARQDWLEGDTIVINLEPARTDSIAPALEPSGEREREYQIETIVARVGARSLYRLPPQDSTARAGVDLPAVHYVLGDEITIHMSEGEVEAMQVVGQTRGVHLEPLRRVGATGDTIAVDTTGVGDDVGGVADDMPPPGNFLVPATQRPSRDQPYGRRVAPARPEPTAEIGRSP